MATTTQQVEQGQHAQRTHRAAAPAPAPAVRNHRDEWVAVIPSPRTRARHTCACGAAFWTFDGYRGHYVLVHVMALEAM